MNIIKPSYNWAKPLTTREATNYIVLHQRAGWGTAESIHQLHIANGWSGIGYNFYVRQDGTIYEGRPVYASGAHTENYNWESVGVCAEGYYSDPPGYNLTPDKVMPEAQKKAIVELVAYLRALYPGAQIVGHSTLNETDCPGCYYPFEEIVKLATGAVKVIVGGQSLGGYILAGTTYVPVRSISEALGQKVGWDGATQTVTIGAPSIKGKVIEGITVIVGGEVFPGQLIFGSTFVPVRKLAEALGRAVSWNAATRAVTVI
jgi:hypothetical protein